MIFFIFSKCQTIFFSEKSSDYGINGQEEQKETPGTLGCSYMGLHSAVIAAYEMLRSLVGSEMCIRDRIYGLRPGTNDAKII